MKHYPDASMTVYNIDRLGKPDGLLIIIGAEKVEKLDEAIRLLSQLREAWQRDTLDS